MLLKCPMTSILTDMSSNLKPITKTMAGTLWANNPGRVRRRECWEATTTDGEWAFERIEEPGTPWIVVHHPRTPQAETVSAQFGTLKAARQAVERGLEPWLPSVQRAAHERGEHATPSPYSCPTCNEERWNKR